MNKLTPFHAITLGQFNWQIIIYKKETSFDDALRYSQSIVHRIEGVENLSSCASDLSFNNCILIFEKRCNYNVIKDTVKILNGLIERPFEIMCYAEDSEGKQTVGVSNPDQVWGVTISRGDHNAGYFKEFIKQCKNIRLIHADNLYLNYIFNSAYFEAFNINPFLIFLITPYPCYDELFPWKDSGFRYNIRPVSNQTLWDTSGDDLSILPEMW